MIKLQGTNTGFCEHMSKEPTLNDKPRPGKAFWGGHIFAELGRVSRMCLQMEHRPWACREREGAGQLWASRSPAKTAEKDERKVYPLCLSSGTQFLTCRPGFILYQLKCVLFAFVWSPNRRKSID